MTMVAQVFLNLMHLANPSKHLLRERTASGSLSAGTARREVMDKEQETDEFRKELCKKIKESKGLSNIQTKEGDIKWALVQNTGYDISKIGGKSPLAALANRVVDETTQAVLMSRKMLLRKKGWSELRTALWLATNEWLRWNGSGIDQPEFNYWDRIREQKIKEETWYSEEKIERILELYSVDLKILTDLGDGLTTNPGLTNNPDQPARKRIISVEAYETIKKTLDVGVFS